jgi:NAD(P)-dependent dehydrogenase (short-subunit alcohol dehydrogenase family)
VQRRERAEFLVGQVADGDDQVAVFLDAADVPGRRRGSGSWWRRGGGDRAGVDGLGRVRASRRGGDRLGGSGIAARVDHLDQEQVRRLAERVRDEHGRLDILVNDIWGAERLKGGPADWNTPVWQHDLDAGLRILRLGVETHLITSHYLLPLLIERPGGLLVEVTDGTTEFNASRYRISVFYDLAKAAVNRLAFSQGHELAARGATAVAVTPGWLRSEMMLDKFGVTEENWRAALEPRPG